MLTLAKVVLVKELRESLRDRRSLASAAAATLAGPLVAGFAIAGRAQATSSGVPRGLGALAVFLLVSPFIMGMGAANDVTAGERERGSLEPLLLTQAPPFAVAAGKWTAAAILNVAGLVLTLVCVLGILGWLGLEAPGLSRAALPALAIRFAAAALPLALFAAALQIVVALHARTFKEGQTSLSLLLFWPMIAGMLLEFARGGRASHALSAVEEWRLMLPVFAQHHLLSSMLRGEMPGTVALAGPAIIALALSAALVMQASVLLTRERIIFGR